jgi:hypothetical protein
MTFHEIMMRLDVMSKCFIGFESFPKKKENERERERERERDEHKWEEWIHCVVLHLPQRVPTSKMF